MSGELVNKALRGSVTRQTQIVGVECGNLGHTSRFVRQTTIFQI